MEWGHGGDVKGYALQYGRKPLDFSANVSPFGVPEGVKQAVMDSLAWGAEYPDPLCRELRQALGEHLGLPAEWILCGNGASDLLFRLAGAVKPKRALLTAPAFSEYEGALRPHQCQLDRFPLRAENGFCLTEEFLNWITPETDLIFLCQPNNPTGRTTDRALLLCILRRCRETKTILALDECFLDFVDMPEMLTMQGELEGNPAGDLPGVYEVLWYGGAAAGLLPLWGSAASGKNEPIGAAMGGVFGGSGGGDCGPEGDGVRGAAAQPHWSPASNPDSGAEGMRLPGDSRGGQLSAVLLSGRTAWGKDEAKGRDAPGLPELSRTEAGLVSGSGTNRKKKICGSLRC